MVIMVVFKRENERDERIKVKRECNISAPSVKNAWVWKVDTIHSLRRSGSRLT